MYSPTTAHWGPTPPDPRPPSPDPLHFPTCSCVSCSFVLLFIFYTCTVGGAQTIWLYTYNDSKGIFYSVPSQASILTQEFCTLTKGGYFTLLHKLTSARRLHDAGQTAEACSAFKSVRYPWYKLKFNRPAFTSTFPELCVHIVYILEALTTFRSTGVDLCCTLQ